MSVRFVYEILVILFKRQKEKKGLATTVFKQIGMFPVDFDCNLNVKCKTFILLITHLICG